MAGIPAPQERETRTPDVTCRSARSWLRLLGTASGISAGTGVGRGALMGQAVVHVEVVGSDPERLRRFYGELFSWEFGLGDATTPLVSAPGQYGFVDGAGGPPVNGGVGGGPGYAPRAMFYVGVDEVEAALRARREDS
jgi:predicted enzyme related to lactoylglutathione lyase